MKTILRSEKKTVTIDTAGPLIIVGEKINPTGRYIRHYRQAQKALAAEVAATV